MRTQFLALPQLLLDALFSRTEAPSSIDEVYERFRMLARVQIEGLLDWLREARATWDERAPGILRVDDCFFDGPIARARSWITRNERGRSTPRRTSRAIASGDSPRGLSDVR